MPTKRQSLLSLIDKFAPEIEDAFAAAIQNIKDDAIIARILDALKQGDVTAAVDALGLEPAAFRALTVAIETAFEQGGIYTMSQFGRQITGAVFRFDVRNSSAEAWLRENSSTLVQAITDEQLTVVQSVLEEGLASGVNPTNLVGRIVGYYDATAGQRVGGVLGLNSQQSQWLDDARQELTDLDPNYFTRTLRDKRFDSTVQKAIDSGTPLDQATIDKLSTRYSDKLLQYRAETIGRTESISALNQSQQEAVGQLLETDNSLQPSDIQRIWDATHDGRTRKSHLDMNNQTVGPDEPFKTPSGVLLMYPGDRDGIGEAEDVASETINCRCHIRLEVDFIGAYKRGKRQS